MKAQPTQSCMDIAGGIYWLAEQIMETCQDIEAGSYEAGTFVLGPPSERSRWSSTATA